VSSLFVKTIVSAIWRDRCAGSVKGREMNKHRGVCYLCGKEGVVTDDHVLHAL
jgi:hypothetical protein